MVADEIVTYLAAAGLGLVASGAGINLYPTPYPLSAPDRAVAVDVYGGRKSDRTFGPSLQAPANEYPLFHVFVRDSRNNGAAAASLADSIYKALDNLGPTTLSGVAYRDVVSVDGPPKFLGFDENQRPMWVLNFQATKDRS